MAVGHARIVARRGRSSETAARAARYHAVVTTAQLASIQPTIEGSQEVRVYTIPARPFRSREHQVMHVDALDIARPRCHGARLRIESITLPAAIGYRFAIGVVCDDEETLRRAAKKYPLHGATLSNMSAPLSLKLYVKRRFEIHVIRRAIGRHYRFLGEEAEKHHLVVDTLRPTEKEPETIEFTGSVTLLIAPPNGWN
jgi:hypothetical protein